MFGIVQRLFLFRNLMQRARRAWLGTSCRHGARSPRPLASMPVLPGAIASSRAQRYATRLEGSIAVERAFWISIDPCDPRRTVMAGTPKEVCRVLDVLLAMENRQRPAMRSSPAA